MSALAASHHRMDSLAWSQDHPHEAQTPTPLTFGGLTSTPDTRLLEFIDPDAPTCATMNN